MNQMGWAIASAVVVITLVQLVAFYYLMRGGGDRSLVPSSTGDGGSGGARGMPPTDTEEFPDTSERRRLDGDDVDRCTHCGTPNEADPQFVFCRNCGAEL